MFLVISLLVIHLGQLPAKAVEETPEIEKVYCNATLEDDFTEDEIIIVVNPEWNEQEYTENDFTSINCSMVEEIADSEGEGVLSRILMLTIADGTKQKVLDAIKVLEQREDVHSAEPNYLEMMEGTYVSTNTSPNTSTGDVQYADAAMNMDSSPENPMWPVEVIDLEEAREIQNPGNTVYVGVIDSGIDLGHPSLMLSVDCEKSKSFVYNKKTHELLSPISDVSGHGTHVAGIITCRNSADTAGVCANVKLVSLRVWEDDDSTASIATITEAIEYAESVGLQILNYSGGGYGSPEKLKSIESRRVAIANFPGLVVCSAGNDDNNNDTKQHYPSGHRLPNLIAVGASTENDTKWDDSNYGQTTVDIFAPGENILSCFPMNLCGGTYCGYPGHVSHGYHYMSGTSMAAPFVTGVAALLLSENPNLTPAQIKAKIMVDCDKIPAFANYCVSGGRLNAYKALLGVNTYTVITCEFSIVEELGDGEYHWYKFESPENGWYKFYSQYTQSYLDVKGELFYVIVPAGSTQDRIDFSDDLYEPDDGNDPDRNFELFLEMDKGDTVYIRVSAYDAGSYQFLVYKWK